MIQKTLTTPVLIDKEIELIRTTLDTELSWLTYSMGEAKKIYSKVNDRDVYYPGVEQTYKQDYYNCFPDDRIDKALSFVYIPGGEKPLNHFDGGLSRGAEIDIIFFADMYNIDSALQRDITRDLQSDVEYVIFKSLHRLTLKEVFTGIENTYKDFTFQSIEKGYLHPRFTTLRFRCDLRYTISLQAKQTFTP